MKVLFILIFASMLVALVLIRFRDKLYLKQKTKNVISDAVKKEIEKDKADFERRRNLFDQALKKVKSNNDTKS